MDTRNILWSVIVLVSIFLLVSESEACNCLVNHPQTKYCYADFVVQARILEKKNVEHPDTTRPTNYRILIGYRVALMAVYKGGDYLGDEDEVWIHTPDAGGLCGVPGLVKGDVYLLSGRYTRDLFYMTYCNLWSEWHKLTRAQQVGMTTIYSNNCQCRIRGVIGVINVADKGQDITMPFVRRSPLWAQDSCRFNPVASMYYKTQDCETMYSQCVYTNDTCMWKQSEDYHLCYEAREAVWRHRNTLQGMFALKRRPRCKASATRFVRRCAAAKKRRLEKKRLAEILATTTTTELTGSEGRRFSLSRQE